MHVTSEAANATCQLGHLSDEERDQVVWLLPLTSSESEGIPAAGVIFVFHH